MPEASAAQPTGVWAVQIDPDTLAFQATTPQGRVSQRGPRLSTQDIIDHMNRAGIETTSPQVQAEADDLYLVVSGVTQGNSQFKLQGMGMRSVSEAWDAFDNVSVWNGIYVAGWLILWVISLVWATRRLGRNQDQPRSEQTTNKI